jgi:transcriptional regulator with XRE-family HTH domain
MSTEYSRSLGARLRSIRTQQGLSLQGVEEKSNGRWKAVVVGSYERGDRAEVKQSEERATKIVLDLEKLYESSNEELGYVARYARAIQQQRGDYNGRVLSIRADDMRALAIMYDKSPSEFTDRLAELGVLVPDPRAFFAS